MDLIVEEPRFHLAEVSLIHMYIALSWEYLSFQTNICC
jgi:hypothetical protein